TSRGGGSSLSLLPLHPLTQTGSASPSKKTIRRCVITSNRDVCSWIARWSRTAFGCSARQGGCGWQLRFGDGRKGRLHGGGRETWRTNRKSITEVCSKTIASPTNPTCLGKSRSGVSTVEPRRRGG